jgi:hypothetical protein
MSRKAKEQLTAETVRESIDAVGRSAMAQLAHKQGYKGSVSSSPTRKYPALTSNIDALLKRVADPATADTADENKADPRPKKAASNSRSMPAARTAGKWPYDERSPFRPGSSYDTCFSILATNKDGLPRATLVELLAKATGKDLCHAGYDAQVLLSARGNEPGLNRNDGPRHRSCRPGFWVKRKNDNVTLMVD